MHISYWRNIFDFIYYQHLRSLYANFVEYNNLLLNDLVGCCGLRPYRIEDKTYEIGFHISSKFWRQGFAYEASREVILYAFNKLDCYRLFAGHNPENKGSNKLLLKLGFKYSHDEFYPPTGLNHPSYYLEKADYNNFR